MRKIDWFDFSIVFLAVLLLTPASLANGLQFGKTKPISELGIGGISPIPFLTLHKVKEIKFKVNLSEANLYKVNSYDYIKVAELEPFTAPGEPQLPMKTFVVKLPLNAEIKDVKIVSGSYVEILNELNIVPTPKPLVWLPNTEQEIRYVPDKEVYSLNEYFPGKAISYEVGRDNYNTYVYVRVYPLQYNPKQKKAILITDADINIYYSTTRGYSQSFFLVSLESFASSNLSLAESIIITPPEFYQQAMELAEFHEQVESINTTVVNTTWIWTNYVEAPHPPFDGCADGCDDLIAKGYNYSLARKIIAFLNETISTNPNIKYITLLGNTLYIPPSYYVDDWIVTDFFYSSPDYDLVPNYMVGRLPVDNVTEAQHVVRKIINWYGNLSNWFNNIVVAGGKPFDSEFYIGELIITDAINRGYLSGMNIIKQFRTDNTFNKANMNNALSGGNIGFIYHIGHGSGDGMELKHWEEMIYVEDVLPYSPNSNVSILVSIACGNGQYDIDIIGGIYGDYKKSFGEAVLLSKAGSVAYIGGSRTNYGGIPVLLDKGRVIITEQPYMQAMLTYVFKAYSEGGDTLGNITTEAMKTYYAKKPVNDNDVDKVTFFAFTLLGDPALKIPPKPQVEGYQTPSLTASDPDFYENITEGMETPIYSLDIGESVTVNSVTDSPSIETKLINTKKWENETIERVRNQFNYTFIPPENALYLIRTISQDEKEGWLYIFAQIIPKNVTLHLSAPTVVREGEWVQVYGEVKPPLVMNFTATLTFPNGIQRDLGTKTSDQQGWFDFSFNTYGYPSGEYTVTVQGQLETLRVEGTIRFRILDYDELRILLLSSKNFNVTNCEQYNFTACRIWPIATTGIIDENNCGNNCDILEISMSKKVHNTTINTPDGVRYIAVVDTTFSEEYDMVFIDDDPIFLQTSNEEINIPEKGFLKEGSIIGSVTTIEGEKVDIKIAKIATDGNSIILVTPPAEDELPYKVNDWVNFIVLALDDGNPKQGIDIFPKYYYLGKYTTQSQLQNSTTNEFGLSSIYSFPVDDTGIYLIEVNEDWSIIIRVRPPFDVKYSIKDADTGKEKSVFKPGDRIKFEVYAIDRRTGLLTPLQNVWVSLRDPEGFWYSIIMSDIDNDYVYEGTYTLEKDATTGTWHVNIEVESEDGVRDEINTFFEVKTFEVRTFSQKIFVPNESAWILVTAVKLGSAEDYYKIPEFYPIDDPNTTIDECSKGNLGNYRNVVINWVEDKEGKKLNISDWNITNVETFLQKSYRSKYFEEFKKHATELPESFLRQCVIQFNTPIKRSIYSGNLDVKRADTNEWEPGSFTFSVQVIDAYAHPWDPAEGWKWAFPPGSNVSLKVEVWNLYNWEKIEPSDIMDAKITEIRGEWGTVDIINQDFIKTADYALLMFMAPNQTGWYNVKFMLTVQINESGTLKNETGLGEGWFSVRLYDIWGWTEKWMYTSDEHIPIKVSVRDFSGNPISNVKVEVKKVVNLETEEDYTSKTVWQANTTDIDGQTTITLMPTTTWSKGWYSVRLKATDPEGRYEYGWASFEVRNYRTLVETLVNGEWKWKIRKGDIITFIPLIWKTSQAWDEPPLDLTQYSIDLDESVLNYYGNEWSYNYEPEKIALAELGATVWQTNYEGVDVWAVNISTDSSLIKPGNYEALIKLAVENEEEQGESWFRIIVFEPHAKVLQRVYGVGEKVSINVSVLPAQTFNVTLKELWGCYEWECLKINVSATTLQCDGNCLYNFSLSADVKEGLYDGFLEFSIGKEVEYERVWFEVKTLSITPPRSVNVYLWQELTNETYVYGYVTSASPCSEIDYNLTLPPEIVNSSCTLLNSTLTQESGYVEAQKNSYLILIDTTTNRIYIDTNLDFTDGSITYNSTINDSFVDNDGIEWIIKDVGYDWLRLEAKNALSNGIKVNLTLSKSGKFRFGWFNESEFRGDWWEETPTDLNDNGELENVYLLAVDSSQAGVYDKIFVEYNVTDLLTKTPVLVGSNTNLGTTPVYIIELTKTVWGDLEVYLAIPEAGSYYPWFGARKINTNITFPVLITYPNGTAIVGVNVSIHKVILSNSKIQELELNYPISKQTDSNGIAVLSYNLTNSGYYTIIPKVQIDDKRAIMERWIAPHVEARAFHVWGNVYSKLADLTDFERQIPIKLETTSFPIQGIEVWLYWNDPEVTPPAGVTDYYAGYTDIGNDKWWFLIDNSTGEVWIDNDVLFNETDLEMQKINVGDGFWLNWTDYHGRVYNVTFKLLSRPSEDKIIFGFELGDYEGEKVVIQDEEGRYLSINGKEYIIGFSKGIPLSYEGNYSAGNGDIGDYQRSWISTNVSLNTISYLSFYWKVSSESGYDFLKFYINDTEKANISGEVDWEKVEFELAPGNYTLKWEYVKDGSVSEGLDTGWIDSIRIISGNTTVFYEDWESGEINMSKWNTGGDSTWTTYSSLNGNFLTVTDHRGEKQTKNVTQGDYHVFYPLKIYVRNITPNSIELMISIGDLKIASYEFNGINYNIIILDNWTYFNGFDLEEWEELSYDSVLISKTGDLSSAVELHPGDSWQDKYISAIDSLGNYITFLNGSIKVLYPPETETDYLVNHINEKSLGTNGIDLNRDEDLEDEFYFVIYDYPWDDITGYTEIVVDDDNDLLTSWICDGECYPIDFKGNETGEEDNWNYLPSDYLRILKSEILFNYQANILTLLEDKWEFEPQENITVLIEAKDFDWTPIKGNLSIVKIKTWDQEFNVSRKLEVELVDGYGLVTIAPQDFKLNETTSLSTWPNDLRIIGNVTSMDGRKEIVMIWVEVKNI